MDPDRETEQNLLNKQIASLQEKEQFLKFKGLESKTLGGTKIEIAANVSSVEELEAVLDNDADAIGRFLRMGITELSVSPAMVLPLRGIVRSIN